MMKTLRQFAMWALIAAPQAAVASPPAQVAPPATAVDGRFEAMLQSLDVVPPSRAAFLVAFPDAPDRLVRVARDVTRDAWTRLRALSMLSFFPTPATADALTRLTQDGAPAIRGEAVLTLGRVFGGVVGAAADPVLAAVSRGLRDAVPEVREKAIRALRWCHDDRAVGLLAEARRDGGMRPLVDATSARRARLLGR